VQQGRRVLHGFGHPSPAGLAALRHPAHKSMGCRPSHGHLRQPLRRSRHRVQLIELCAHSWDVRECTGPSPAASTERKAHTCYPEGGLASGWLGPSVCCAFGMALGAAPRALEMS
jgi:hypothetical protein